MNDDQYLWVKKEIERLAAQDLVPGWWVFIPDPFKMFVLEARYAAISNLVTAIDAIRRQQDERPPERDRGVLQMILLCDLRVRLAVDSCPRDVVATAKSYLFGLGRGGSSMYVRALRDALRDVHKLASDPAYGALVRATISQEKPEYPAAIDLLRRYHCTTEADFYEQFIASTTAASKASVP